MAAFIGKYQAVNGQHSLKTKCSHSVGPAEP